MWWCQIKTKRVYPETLTRPSADDYRPIIYKCNYIYGEMSDSIKYDQ